MALVVFLKGVNVGGHRTLRPRVLARELDRLDVVSIGAAGTFVVRKPIGRAELSAEIARRLPFEAVVMVCAGGDIERLVARAPFAGRTPDRRIIQFVSLMATRRAFPATLPLSLPDAHDGCVTVIAREGRFLAGLHRREMRALRYLARLEKLCGVPLATRSWQTILKISELMRA